MNRGQIKNTSSQRCHDVFLERNEISFSEYPFQAKPGVFEEHRFIYITAEAQRRKVFWAFAPSRFLGHQQDTRISFCCS
jgi:hypothetical protein